MFNVKIETNKIIENIKDWFCNKSSKALGCTINISGGKDSTVVATLLVRALGKDKVFGILQPNGIQKDISDSLKVCEILGIDYEIVNIEDTYKSICKLELSDEAKINVLPRIRMTYAYAIAQTKNYRVIGTSNASETYVGYFTKWGDNANDFNPIKDYTCTEVIQIGDELGLPYELTHKTPSDGLSGKSDEEKLGITYKDLDNYLRDNKDGISEETIRKIEHKHNISLHKILK